MKLKPLKLDWDINAGTKGGFPFYMEKEICEQPDVLRKTINSRIKKLELKDKYGK